MQIPRKQQQEIDFLIEHFVRSEVSKEDKEEFCNVTARGGKGMFTDNPLLNAKRKLDITVKMWREDLCNGHLAVFELQEDFTCPYGKRVINSVIKSVTPEYRKKNMSDMTILSYTNFPETIYANTNS